MAEVSERKQKTVHDLCSHIDGFISDNRHSGQVDVRWLVAFMVEPLKVARQVLSGALDDNYRKSIAGFRCAEIASEKQRLSTEIEILEREAKKLTACAE